MSRCIGLVPLLVCGVATLVSAAQPTDGAAGGNELKVNKAIVVGGLGTWDEPALDPASHRLFVGRGNRVVVVDAEQGKAAGEIAELNGARGVALAPDKNLGFVACGRDSAIVVFDLGTLKVTKKLKASPDAETILYDPATQKVFAFGNKSVTVVNVASLDQPPQIGPLPGVGKLGAAIADGKGRVFVTDEQKNAVLVLDSKQQKPVAPWPVDPGKGPAGLTIDTDHKRIYVACGNQKLVVLDSESGKVVANVAIGAGAEGVAYDPQLGIVTANGRDGTMSVIRENPPGTFTVVQTLKTVATAKTVAADPKIHSFYLPAMLPGEKGASEFGVVLVNQK